MADVFIRGCTREDEQGIVNVCYRTGYMGEDLTGRNIFNDIKLFGLMFCSYYCRYEAYNCFVAVDREKNNEIVGYIIGTLDSKRQERMFKIKMGWKIASRVIFHTIWNHRETVKTIIYFIKNLNLEYKPREVDYDYPAHLHINILPEYQRFGLGSMLIESFEEHVRRNRVKGIHLITSNKNIKALPFYIKRGYSIIYENESNMWERVNRYKSIVFGKKMIDEGEEYAFNKE